MASCFWNIKYSVFTFFWKVGIFHLLGLVRTLMICWIFSILSTFTLRYCTCTLIHRTPRNMHIYNDTHINEKENCRRDHNSNSFFFFKNFSFFNPYNTCWQLNDINIMKNMAIWKLTYNQKPLQKSHYWIHYLCTVWRFPIGVHSIQILHQKFSSTCPCKSLYKDNLFWFFMQLNNGTWQFEA